MQFLTTLLELSHETASKTGFERLERQLSELRSLLNEGAWDNHHGDLEKQFDQLEQKLVTARRALGMINSAGGKLSPERISSERSRIMTHINNFRAALQSLMIEMGMNQREIDYHYKRLGDDRKFGKPNERFTFNSKEKFSDVHNRRRNLTPHID